MKEEINKIIVEHGKWLLDITKGQRANLTGADLRGANLRGVDLRGADLRGADLGDADLTGANLTGANLRRANLRRVDLRSANLTGVDLRSANLRDAALTGVKYGEEELLKLNTVLDLEWDILMFQETVTVGCKKYSLEEWRNFSNIEIEEMDKKALGFYPVLMAILKYEYRNTKWSF